MEVPRVGVESELQLWAYTTAHGNAGSLIHWAKPGIKPTISWMLVRFISTVHDGNSWLGGFKALLPPASVSQIKAPELGEVGSVKQRFHKMKPTIDLLFFTYLFLDCPHGMQKFPDQGSNPGPPQRQCQNLNPLHHSRNSSPGFWWWFALWSRMIKAFHFLVCGFLWCLYISYDEHVLFRATLKH